MSAPHHRWLLEQLPQWQQEGLLTAEAAEILRKRATHATADESSNTAQIVMGSLGALLVGMGLIAVIGYNWDHFSNAIRLLFAFIPLLAAQLFTWRVLRQGAEAPHWHRETAALLQALAAGAALAIVSQIYNLGGEWPQFLLAWLILSLPLTWLLGANSLVMAYLIGAMCWIVDAAEATWRGFGSGWIYLGLLAGLVPYALSLGRGNRVSWPSSVRWIAVLTGTVGLGALAVQAVRVQGFSYHYRWEAEAWLCLVNTAILMMIPLSKAGRAEDVGQKPQVMLGLMLLLGAGFLMTLSDGMRSLSKGVHLALGMHWTWIALTLLVVFGGLVISHRRWAVLGAAGIVLLPLLGAALTPPDSEVSLAWMATLYLSVAGLALIGLEFMGRQGAPRLGATLLCGLIITRFADSHLSLLGKGVAFIVVGACFLVFNIYIGRWLKARRASLV